jgi:putative FmdB family regulatory protein
MPIYAYKCASCGHAKDVLQKISDPQLTVCPACGKETFSKQVTAAGFQLKGSGWYATDFKGGATPAADKGDTPADKAADKPADGAAKSETKAEPKTESKAESTPATKPAAPSAAD